MRRYLVDTNIPSELTREQPDERVTAFIRQAGQQNLFLSVMTIGEIRKGVDGLALSRKRSELEAWLEIDVRNWFMGRILPVTEAIAERWGPTGCSGEKKWRHCRSCGWCHRGNRT